MTVPASTVLAATAVAGAGLASGLSVLGLSEAGIPVPVPADIVALYLGERASAGQMPVWLALVIIVAVAAAGTTTLFLACRGPARGLINRLGPRVGLTAVRLKRVRSAIERRGRVALAVGRATPGLRTLTVVAAATSGARATVALPAVVAGSAVFLGGHVILGYVAGSAAREFIHRATGPAILVAAVLVLGAAVVWLVRRGRRGAAGAFAESACPACVMLGAVAMRSGVDAVGAEEKT